MTSIAIGFIMYSVDKFKRPSSLKNAWKQFINCNKCTSFWIMFAVYQDFTLAALVSLTVFLLETFIVTKL